VVPLRESESDMIGGDLAIHGMDPMPEFGRTPTLEPVGAGPVVTR